MFLIRILARVSAVYALATPVVERDAAMIQIATYTDNLCNTPSTTAQNTSIPLDSCVVSIGMESFRMDKMPCSGGGLPSVKAYAFSDTSCSKQSGPYKESNVCYGSGTRGEAFGSILLTCTDYGIATPKPAGTTTITVGSAVPASTGTTSSSGSSSSSGPSSSSSSAASSSSSGSNDAFSPLSTGAKAGIGGGIAALLALLGGGALINKFVLHNSCSQFICCDCSKSHKNDQGHRGQSDYLARQTSGPQNPSSPYSSPGSMPWPYPPPPGDQYNYKSPAMENVRPMYSH